MGSGMYQLCYLLVWWKVKFSLTFQTIFLLYSWPVKWSFLAAKEAGHITASNKISITLAKRTMLRNWLTTSDRGVLNKCSVLAEGVCGCWVTQWTGCGRHLSVLRSRPDTLTHVYRIPHLLRHRLPPYNIESVRYLLCQSFLQLQKIQKLLLP